MSLLTGVLGTLMHDDASFRPIMHHLIHILKSDWHLKKYFDYMSMNYLQPFSGLKVACQSEIELL